MKIKMIQSIYRTIGNQIHNQTRALEVLLLLPHTVNWTHSKILKYCKRHKTALTENGWKWKEREMSQTSSTFHSVSLHCFKRKEKKHNYITFTKKNKKKLQVHQKMCMQTKTLFYVYLLFCFSPTHANIHTIIYTHSTQFTNIHFMTVSVQRHLTTKHSSSVGLSYRDCYKCTNSCLSDSDTQWKEDASHI